MTAITPTTPAIIQAANTGAFGLLPASDFCLADGNCQDSETIPQALWFFRDERIALPLPGRPLAGFARALPLADDLAVWSAATPLGTVSDYPPLVWTAADGVVSDARLSADNRLLCAGGVELPFTLAPRHPLNQAWYDASSAHFFTERALHVRGDWRDGRFVARTIWPLDFRLPAMPTARPLTADPLALRERIREQAQGGAASPFTVEQLWRRPGSAADSAGRPVLAFVLSGAQGDDDEAHGGHFAAATGRIGAGGAMHDWLAFNFYPLDKESEKGIVSAPLPLDNYLADINAGQAWYRPSYVLVAVLRSPRVAAHIQSALGRVVNQFYRHQFAYHHASANCTGITVDALRALGWRIPATGAESWLQAAAALPWLTLTRGRLQEGKDVFDYLSEDRTRLFPAMAFEGIGSELLHLAQGDPARPPTPFESALAEDLDALLLVRLPQLPSSRTLGNYPVVSNAEYRQRLPRAPAQWQIVPVAPRPFPRELRDPLSPHAAPQRSDYAVGAIAAGLLALAGLGLSLLV